MLQIAWTCICALTVWICALAFVYMCLICFYVSAAASSLCMFAYELDWVFPCVFSVEQRERERCWESSLWFWNWLCRNPPRLKRSFSPCERNKGEKNDGVRERVCERKRETQRERGRDWFTHMREGGHSYSMSHTFKRPETPHLPPPPHLSITCTYTHSLLSSFLFKGKTLPWPREEVQRVITLVSSCPPPPPPPLLSHLHLVVMTKHWQLCHIQPILVCYTFR